LADAESRRHRWGRTRGKIGSYAGKIKVARPRSLDFAGRELVLPNWERPMA
jgi:hypothetical protein